MVDGLWYLEGWCHRAEEVRLFRVDRIEGLTVLDVAAEPRRVPERDLREGLFRPSPEDTVVTLELDPGARWVVDYYPVEDVQELASGQLLVRLRAADDRWLRDAGAPARRGGPGARPARARRRGPGAGRGGAGGIRSGLRHGPYGPDLSSAAGSLPNTSL